MNDPRNTAEEGIPEFLLREDDEPKAAPKRVRTTKVKPEPANEPETDGEQTPAVPADAPETPAQPKAAKTTKKRVTGRAAVEKDAFGFAIGTLKSRAASLYAARDGATAAEVKAALGSLQLNLLTVLVKRGFTVTKAKEKADKNERLVTRYFLKP